MIKQECFTGGKKMNNKQNISYAARLHVNNYIRQNKPCIKGELFDVWFIVC